MEHFKCGRVCLRLAL